MVEAHTLNCPSCGGRVELANRFVKMVVCPYCGNALAVSNDRLDPTGKTAALADTPTRFAVGQRGRLREQPFQILGRVRYEDEESYWDEWYLQFADGSIAWLEEEEGACTLSRAEPLTGPVPPFDEVRVGTTLAVNGRSFFVTERCRARVAGAEGQLYFRARPGRAVRFVDGNVGGRLAFLEYGEDEIAHGIGDPVPADAIVLEGE
jgi:hypothetical protein